MTTNVTTYDYSSMPCHSRSTCLLAKKKGNFQIFRVFLVDFVGLAGKFGKFEGILRISLFLSDIR